MGLGAVIHARTRCRSAPPCAHPFVCATGSGDPGAASLDRFGPGSKGILNDYNKPARIHATVVAYMALAVSLLVGGTSSAGANTEGKTPSKVVSENDSAANAVSVYCPKGWTATGGGYDSGDDFFVDTSRPKTSTTGLKGWEVSGSGDNFFRPVWVICADFR